LTIKKYNLKKENVMLVETKQMMPITRLQKELTQTVRNLSNSGNKENN
jgi:hypothetical protein